MDNLKFLQPSRQVPKMRSPQFCAYSIIRLDFTFERFILIRRGWRCTPLAGSWVVSPRKRIKVTAEWQRSKKSKSASFIKIAYSLIREPQIIEAGIPQDWLSDPQRRCTFHKSRKLLLVLDGRIDFFRQIQTLGATPLKNLLDFCNCESDLHSA